MLQRFDSCISLLFDSILYLRLKADIFFSEVGDPFPLKSTHNSGGHHESDWVPLIPSAVPETIRIASPDGIPPVKAPEHQRNLGSPKGKNERVPASSGSGSMPTAKPPSQRMVPRVGDLGHVRQPKSMRQFSLYTQ